MTERYKYRGSLPLTRQDSFQPPLSTLNSPLTAFLLISSSTELKARLEAARIERERREQETHEQEERELQSLMEEEDRARREQQRADEARKRAEEAEAKRKAEEERVAGEQRPTAETEGTEGSQEANEATGEGWETDIARLHAAAMAGGSKDDGEEYRTTEDTCWNCRHRKLVCERPE